MSGKISCSVEHEKKFYNLGASLFQVVDQTVGKNNRGNKIYLRIRLTKKQKEPGSTSTGGTINMPVQGNSRNRTLLVAEIYR